MVLGCLGRVSGDMRRRRQIALVWIAVLAAGVKTVRMGHNAELAMADVVPALRLKANRCARNTPAQATLPPLIGCAAVALLLLRCCCHDGGC